MLSRRVVIRSDISCIYLGRPLFAIGSTVGDLGLSCLTFELVVCRSLLKKDPVYPTAKPFHPSLLGKLNDEGGLGGVESVDTLSQQLILRRPVAVVSCAVLDVRYVLAWRWQFTIPHIPLEITFRVQQSAAGILRGL